MKKLLSLLMCGLLLFGCGDKYDDSALRNDLNDLENRVAKLEELCKQMNTNISSLQKIVEALQDNLSISKVEQISDGYIIHFSDGSTATIKNGKNSEDAPIIGVKKDTDGIYYWTLDGEWLTDEKGNKVKAQGTDGKDGVDFVLVFKLSRFGRNAADVLSSLQLMQDYGVNLICVEEGIDSSKEAGKLLISIIAAVAELERENIRVQTMAGREQKAREARKKG